MTSILRLAGAFLFACLLNAQSSFVTGFAPNASKLRNDFSGLVGMRIVVGSSPLTLTSLGRICVAGNTGTHIVKIVDMLGADVAGASVSLAMSGCTPGTFAYVQGLSAVLSAGSTYFVVSQEVQGADRWYDQGAITTTTDASVTDSMYFYGVNWISNGGSSTSYVPVNFQYSIAQQTSASPNITVQTVQGPQGPPGIQGIQGIQGIKGDKGDPGTNAVGTGSNGIGFTTGGSNALDCVTVSGVCDIVTALVPLKPAANGWTGVNSFSQLRVSLYTVATLPTCNTAVETQMEGVTDARPVTYLSPVVGGGSLHIPVYCNGSSWIAH